MRFKRMVESWQIPPGRKRKMAREEEEENISSVKRFIGVDNVGDWL